MIDNIVEGTPHGKPTRFQLDILVVVCELKEPSGADIRTRINEIYPAKKSNQTIFGNLGYLQDNGYVEESRYDWRTNCYTITDEGVDLIKERIDFLENYKEKFFK